MSIIHLNDRAVGDTLRTEFLTHVARCYDEMVKDGHTPDSIVFVLAQLKGVSAAHWSMQGEAREAISAVLARAAYSITRAANKAADRL